MKYQKITHFDTANGTGIRMTLFVSGCEHYCEGCHNPETWNPDTGKEFTDETLNEILTHLENPYIAGITLSGGDPLFPSNRPVILNIVRTIKEKFSNTKNIWIYTGYSWEDVFGLKLMEYVDVLVDGRFILSQKDISLPWCGSTNQRVIDVPKSLFYQSVKPYENS